METEEFIKRRLEAAEQFDLHEKRSDAARVAGSLADGLTMLRDLLYARVHDDVEKMVGMDSMLVPVSELKSQTVTKTEIELYQIAESAAAAREHGYLGTTDDWYLQWLARFRLGTMRSNPKAARRLTGYLSKPPDERRLAFTNVLASASPEWRQAPLVLFRLAPLAVEIVTALAFGDHPSAADARSRQVDYLPAIRDCRACNAGLLENGDRCRECENPIWKFEWLTATD